MGTEATFRVWLSGGNEPQLKFSEHSYTNEKKPTLFGVSLNAVTPENAVDLWFGLARIIITLQREGLATINSELTELERRRTKELQPDGESPETKKADGKSNEDAEDSRQRKQRAVKQRGRD